MDILTILDENESELTDEDIEFLITELETGKYDAVYFARCMQKIEYIKASRITAKGTSNYGDSGIAGARIPVSELIPDYKSQEVELSPEEQLWKTVNDIRHANNRFENFKNFLLSEKLFTEEFISKNFKMFDNEEVGIITENIMLSEQFLENYLSELDALKISKYQKFSEAFFMKHFDVLNTNAVLTKGPNEWRKKADRSSKLNVFLKLKGVTI